MIESAYIHIPFCNHICSYCDFAKVLYHKKWISNYLDALKQEIQSSYQNELLKTIYIGGGTPTSLDLDEFKSLLKIINTLKKQKKYEYTIECNVESITEDKIICMKQYGVNRISIGVETFHKHHLRAMNRHHTKDQVIDTIQLFKKHGFQNINIDLIYALPHETIEEVKSDLCDFLKLNIPHISTYSLMIEPNTSFYINQIQPIDETLDFNMYEEICTTLKKNGYIHYEISNFAKPGYESGHNLTYWNNDFYYGFGLGASGYENEIRYTNTRSFTNYCKGQYRIEEEKITSQIKLENEMILGLRKLEGIYIKTTEQKYGVELHTLFPIQKLQKKGKLQIHNGYLQIPENQLYLSNDILMQFIGEQNE